MAFLLSWSLLHSVAIKGYNATLLSLYQQFHLYLLRVGCSQGNSGCASHRSNQNHHLPGAAAFIGAGRVGSANGDPKSVGRVHQSVKLLPVYLIRKLNYSSSQ